MEKISFEDMLWLGAYFPKFQRVCRYFNETGALSRVTLMMLKNSGPVPEVGKFYHFFDKMELGPDSHYVCRITRIFTPFEAREILFPPKEVFVYDKGFQKIGEELGGVELHSIWRDRVMERPDLYSDETEYIVEAECPKYDKEKLYFVRGNLNTLGGAWLSINVAHDWQMGSLDVSGSVYDHLIKGPDAEKYKQKTF